MNMSDDFDGFDGEDDDVFDNVVPFKQDENDTPVDRSKFKHTEKQTEHTLEGLFNIEEGTTVVPYIEREPTVLVKHETYDDKDNEIEEQLQEIIDHALEAFENSSEDADSTEPQFKARNREVAAQFLNTALSAINSKSSIKQQKDKLEKMIAKGQGGQVTNNIIVDRNDLLRALRSDEDDAIDGELADD